MPMVAGQGAVSLVDAISDGTETNYATVRKTPQKFREEFVVVLGKAVVDMMTDSKAAADRHKKWLGSSYPIRLNSTANLPSFIRYAHFSTDFYSN